MFLITYTLTTTDTFIAERRDTIQDAHILVTACLETPYVELERVMYVPEIGPIRLMSAEEIYNVWRDKASL